MTELPTNAQILDQDIITANWKTYYGEIVDFIRKTIDGSVRTSVQVLSGKITPRQSMLSVDTENKSPASDITNIIQDNVNSSQWLILFAENETRKVTIKNGSADAGGIYTIDEKDILLSVDFPLILYKRDNFWQQLDLSGYIRATDEEFAEGISEYKVPTLAQIKPFLSEITSTQIGIVYWAVSQPPGTLLASQSETYQAEMFPYVWEGLISGKYPSLTFAEYDSEISLEGFCDKYALDTTNNVWKTPHLTSVKFGNTDYLPYIGAYTSSGDKSVVELQVLLDTALQIYNDIEASSSEYNDKYSADMIEYESKKTQYVSDIDNSKNNAIDAITTAKTEGVSAIEDTETIAISELNLLLDSITAEGQKQKNDVISVGSVQTANIQNEGSAIINSATEQKDLAKNWAIGTIEENPEGSAEYWAKKAEESGSGQVQSDWAETITTEKSFIKNKPDLTQYATTSALDSGLLAKQNTLTAGDNIEIVNNSISASFIQAQADWNQAVETEDSYIKNKPSLSEVATSGDYADLTGVPNLSQYATTSALDSGLLAKQNTLTAGDNITIENNVISSTTSGGGGILPDYSAGVDISSGYVCPTDGYVYCFSAPGNTAATVLINGVELIFNKTGSYATFRVIAFMPPVSKGDVITFSGLNKSRTTFYPMKV